MVPYHVMKIKTSRAIASHHPVVHGGLEANYGGSGGVAADDNNNRQFRSHHNIIDFSSNVGPAGMPSSVVSGLKKRLDRIEYYPDTRCTELVAALAGYTGLPAANLVVGNGAVDLIYGFCNAFLPARRGDVLIAVPTFGEYEAAARLAGSHGGNGNDDDDDDDTNHKISFFKTMDLAGDIDSFVSMMPSDGCVFVCNPNNPTGSLLAKRHLTRIITQAKHLSSLVFVDECFIEMVPDRPSESVLPLVRRHGNLFVLRSLTKSFGLAGIRVGYAAASRQMINVLVRTKIPWSINALAQQAGLLSLESAQLHITKTWSIIRAESKFLKNKISRIGGLECYDPSANFILIKTEQDSALLQKRLLDEHGILVRDCKSFRGLNGHHIRIAIRRHQDNMQLVGALEAASG